MAGPRQRRPLLAAERHTPDLLQGFLTDLEATQSSAEVWGLIVEVGRALNLPYIDFICADNFANWKRTLFIRTSYDSTWLNTFNEDPDVAKWSYFRTHAVHHLTPIAVGLEFVDEYHHMPEARHAVLREAAERGLRAGFSVPLRLHAPPQAALITFCGDHSKREMRHIIQTHGWVLNAVAMMGHQRYQTHFAAEFTQRNSISDKQRELLEMIGAGLQDKVIAEQLEISVSAVRQRMNNLLAKTGLANRADLAALAMSVGLVQDPLHRMNQKVGGVLVEMGVPHGSTFRYRKD
ncbi:helix-turn-helix transcriptional regulator [Shimia marina]|uniref:ATP-dependent transcriptional regulator n=1 Tax=Shimia marina TaxID=321267 RepID=A0A0P1EPJ8_9RHOB|nr:LuxR C-terminal-related transcriptional regulator [Shimia marina]CUH52309.1 ATP-dependent transcriptional regulator [Shimia marina]SFE08296.1 regulatory protein, luxR family [Shimia marina]